MHFLKAIDIGFFSNIIQTFKNIAKN